MRSVGPFLVVVLSLCLFGLAGCGNDVDSDDGGLLPGEQEGPANDYGVFDDSGEPGGNVTPTTVDSLVDHDAIVMFLADNFNQLPERQISISEDGTVYAQYAQPTTRYAHGILGDAIEAEQLVVLKNGTIYTQTVADEYVFEDIKPRLVDVDSDGQLEIVTIRTHVKKGAGIMIYKIENDALIEYAWVEEIGAPFRWLNIAAVYDLDGDGTVELAWIQTPHIGGILKVATIQAGKLVVLAESSQYSNHSIGKRNLCLSVVTQIDNATTLYVPTQDRSQIAGFEFTGRSIQNTETISQAVDFSCSLALQHDFTSIVQGENSCAGP
jgi:hypothetical protein